MFFYLSKILGYFLNPTAWIFMSLLAAVVFSGKWRKYFVIAGLVLFFVFSNNYLLKTFLGPWEKHGIRKVENTYDVGIVLGGWIAEYDENLDRAVFKAVPDRFMQAYRLYQTGKIKKILISGGSGHYLYPQKKEAKVLRDYLRSVGVPEDDILVDASSRNTYENAVYSAEILEEHPELQDKLLITSAIHMKRAKACFDAQGISTDPFGTDRIVPGDGVLNFEILFVPDVVSFRYWHLLIHEWIGYVVYDIRGYID
ncbi:MAG: YdcF family protein [Bacteroidota bacterium]